MTYTPTRITLGTIEDLLPDASSKVGRYGEATIRVNRDVFELQTSHETRTLKGPHKVSIMVYDPSSPYIMRDEFLQVIDSYFTEQGMYLADVSRLQVVGRTGEEWLIEGSFYKDKKFGVITEIDLRKK